MLNQPNTAPPKIILEHEVPWGQVAPLLDGLQTIPGFEELTVRRWASRPGAGGPGFDIVPILISVTVSALLVETVRDVIYPNLKEVILRVYHRLPGSTVTGKVYPFGITIIDGTFQAQYRLPEGLSDTAFGQALVSLPIHFAALAREGRSSLVFTYDPTRGSWTENKDASEFLSWLARREAAEDAGGAQGL